jgi:hypothetical protein
MGVQIEAQDLQLLIRSVVDGVTGWLAWMQYVPAYNDVTRFFGRAQTHYEGMPALAGYPNAGSLEYWMGQTDWWRDAKARRFESIYTRSTRRGLTGKSKEQFSWPVLAVSAAAIAAEGGFVPPGGHSEVPGLDNHWAVWALAFGTGNARALRAASYDGAHFVGVEKDLGTVEAGKIADLVILNANPQTDIRNTLSIDAVLLRGRIFDGETMNERWPGQKPYGRYPWSSDDVPGYSSGRTQAIQ